VLAETIRAGSTLHGLDALHLACAQGLRADVFLTTDDALVRAAGRIPAGSLTVTVANPLAWLTDIVARE
jgi:predicted nucleic acid-binding protein